MMHLNKHTDIFLPIREFLYVMYNYAPHLDLHYGISTIIMGRLLEDLR